MINYTLPTTVTVNGEEYAIRNNGDYRLILDVITAMHDPELNDRDRAFVCLLLFYADGNVPDDGQAAINAMTDFINLGNPDEKDDKPPLMDWEQDFLLVIPPINKALGVEVRSVPFMHWWTFISGYQEIDDNNTFSTVVKIRRKRQRGEKLDKGEQRFMAENSDLVLLKKELSQEDKDFLFLDD